MKKLTGLDDQQYLYEDPKPEDKVPTYRELLRIALGRIVPRTAEQSLNISIVLRNLKSTTAEIDLENDEFKTMKETVATNEAKLFQASHGPLMDYVVACEKASEKKTPLEVK